MFLCHLLRQVAKVSFRCFGMSRFVFIVLPFGNNFLISHYSPVLSVLFPQVILLFFLVLPFIFCFYIFQDFSFVLSFWPVFVDFLSAFSVEFPILVWIFSSYFLRGSQFSHKLISPLHRLVHLIRLYYFLIYKYLIYFIPFPS